MESGAAGVRRAHADRTHEMEHHAAGAVSDVQGQICAKEKTIMKKYAYAVWKQVRAAWRLTMRALANVVTASPAERWQRVECFHHDHKARRVIAIDPAAGEAGDATVTAMVSGGSWIREQLIDLGRNKMWYCTKCNEKWFLI